MGYRSPNKLTFHRERLVKLNESHLRKGLRSDLFFKKVSVYDIRIDDFRVDYLNIIDARPDYSVVFEHEGKGKILKYNG